MSETQSSESKKTFIEHNIKVDKENIALLMKIGFVENELGQFPDLEVDIDQKLGELRIVGPSKQCSEANNKVLRHLAKMARRTVSLSQTVFEMLNSDGGQERVKNELDDKQIDAVFCLDEDGDTNARAFVVGISHAHAEKAADLVRGLTSELKVKVEKESMEIVKTQDWVKLCEEIKLDFNVYVRQNEYHDTWVAGFKQDVARADNRIQSFLDDNSVQTETFCCPDNGVRRYILENRNEELENIKTALKQYYLDIKMGEDGEAFLIYGTEIGIGRARQMLHHLSGSVTMNEHSVKQPGLSKFFTSGGGDRLLKSVEQEHRCTIERSPVAAARRTKEAFEDGDESSDSSSSEESDDEEGATAYPNRRYSQSSTSSPSSTSIRRGNVKISWMKGNIEAVKVSFYFSK